MGRKRRVRGGVRIAVLVLAALTLAGGSSARAATVELNVSRIAIGQQQTIDWAANAPLPKLPCGACTYAATSTAMTDPDLAPSLYPNAWPATPQATVPPPPPVPREVATPQGQVINNAAQVYDSAYWRRGAVDFDLFDHDVSSLIWKSGTAGAMVAYHVRVTNDAAEKRNFFVELGIPTASLPLSYSYAIIPGDNGGTYIYNRQNEAHARSLVDVLVDGLPVWSNTASYHFPADFGGQYFNNIQIAWGDPQTDRVRLYLGRLTAGASLTIDYSVRTDAHADAPTCGKESQTGPAGAQTLIHCYLVNPQRDLPQSGRGLMAPFDFQVYTKAVGGTP